jgi:hypothetical protein
VTAVTNPPPMCSDQYYRERLDIMLLSSILQILDGYQAQPKAAEKAPLTPFDSELAAAAEKLAGPKKSEHGIETPAETVRPVTPHQALPVHANRLEHFIRAITKFEKQKQRVVDVFE